MRFGKLRLAASKKAVEMRDAVIIVVLVGMVFSQLAGTAASQRDCFVDPTAPACASFVVDDAAVAAQMTQLCIESGRGASGWPAACTLWNECQVGRGSDEYCQPLRLLLSACVEGSQATYDAKGARDPLCPRCVLHMH